MLCFVCSYDRTMGARGRGAAANGQTEPRVFSLLRQTSNGSNYFFILCTFLVVETLIGGGANAVPLFFLQNGKAIKYA